MPKITAHWGFIPGLFMTAAPFALMHLGNLGGKPLLNIFAIFNTFLAGIFAGILYCLTQSLWMSIGWHAAWNWSLSSFFGSGLSGYAVQDAAFVTEVKAPIEILSGGAYGIEGSAITTAVYVLINYILWHKTSEKRKNRRLEC